MSQQYDPEWIAEVTAREAAATPGPWDDKVTAVYKDGTAIRICGDFYNFDHDARFIAHAREDIPRLLNLVKQQHEEIAQLKEGLEAMRGLEVNHA